MKLEEIKSIAENLSKQVSENINLYDFVTFGNQEDFAKPNIEIDSANHFYFIIQERGNIIEKK